jgi:predicted transcriptional regulator YdeE
VSLSRDFSEDKTWDYLTGHVVSDCSITQDVYIGFEIPAGRYAVFQIRPRFRFLLGLEMVSAKKYIYGKWISGSRYEFSGFEFEYNNESMYQEKPYNIDLYVGIKDKDNVD